MSGFGGVFQETVKAITSWLAFSGTAGFTRHTGAARDMDMTLTLQEGLCLLPEVPWLSTDLIRKEKGEKSEDFCEPCLFDFLAFST